jgi:hypothetical protein
MLKNSQIINLKKFECNQRVSWIGNIAFTMRDEAQFGAVRIATADLDLANALGVARKA